MKDLETGRVTAQGNRGYPYCQIPSEVAEAVGIGRGDELKFVYDPDEGFVRLYPRERENGNGNSGGTE